MRNISIIIISILILNISLYSYDYSKPLPQWTKSTPIGRYYNYFNGLGTSINSLSNAKKIAISDALSTIVLQGTVEVDSKIFTSISENTEINGKNINATVKDSVISEVMLNGHSSYISDMRIEEEYWQTRKSGKDILYEYWILLRIPKPKYINLNIPSQKGYGFAPVWRSAIIPGWGQFHKGEPQKGWRFLISETFCASSFFVSNYFSHNYSRKAENERDYDKRKFYNDWSNRSYTIGTVSGIVAGAIYIYNVFDSVTAKGAKRYAFQNSSSSLLSFSFFIDF